MEAAAEMSARGGGKGDCGDRRLRRRMAQVSKEEMDVIYDESSGGGGGNGSDRCNGDGQVGPTWVAHGRSTAVPDDKIDAALPTEIFRALRIANMHRNGLVAYLGAVMNRRSEFMRAKIHEAVTGVISDGTIEEYDVWRAEKLGLGCPCCTGGQDMNGATEARTKPVLRIAGSDNGRMVHSISHSAYRLLDNWGDEHGIMGIPTLKEFLRELCTRGMYEYDDAVESVNILSKWRVLAVRRDGVAINADKMGGRLI